MRSGLALTALLLAAVALPVAAAEPLAQYTLTVKPEQVDVIGRALALSLDPHKTVQDLIGQLTQQIVDQQKAAADKPADPPASEGPPKAE